MTAVDLVIQPSTSAAARLVYRCEDDGKLFGFAEISAHLNRWHAGETETCIYPSVAALELSRDFSVIEAM